MLPGFYRGYWKVAERFMQRIVRPHYAGSIPALPAERLRMVKVHPTSVRCKPYTKCLMRVSGEYWLRIGRPKLCQGGGPAVVRIHTWKQKIKSMAAPANKINPETDQLCQFIRANIKVYMVSEMVDEYPWGATMSAIRTRLRIMDLEPLSPTERNKRYVLDMKDKLTAEQIMKKIDISPQYFSILINQLGLTIRDFAREESEIKATGRPKENVEIKKPKGPTPREILSNYQFGNHHYRNNEVSYAYDRINRIMKKALG